ncbi:MAG: 2,3,4,5-tetrahydropyridine-2,6-dicarboxylate N-succinyltransferase [Amoebophilaceae bacterium]|jgi:2,3,4,5-tetrahydropyridine-2-carboxylate N-succinyltransferase|nr:2,3,4,5-tetrahydropyridine-2,6-dicarboxylate N-succinyltransferase [Amoebophilaceae bacterium]
MKSRIKMIEEAWEDRAILQKKEVQAAVESVIDALDQGKQRVAIPSKVGWQVNDWAKKAVLLYFLIRNMEVQTAGPLVFYDKIPLKQNFKELNVRVVPPAVARYGSFLQRGVVLMASYVNIGAYIDEGTMVDIGAVVGSCAQLGKHIHVSAGTTIGGVLEPVQATPVIIEDGVFIGSRCSIVEGIHVQREAVIGANVTLTASTKIIDVTQKDNPKEYRGYIPERSLVIPGTLPKQFPAGQYHVPCALIIGQRTDKTERKVSLNDALRDYNISV